MELHYTAQNLPETHTKGTGLDYEACPPATLWNRVVHKQWEHWPAGASLRLHWGATYVGARPLFAQIKCRVGNKTNHPDEPPQVGTTTDPTTGWELCMKKDS